VIRNTSEQAPKISKEDLAMLNGYAMRNATHEIELKDVRILIDAPGCAVDQMAGGIEDITRFGISPSLIGHIARTSKRLYPINGLRHVPNAAILKLMTIRFGTHDVFQLQYFGHLLFRDPSTIRQKTISVHFSDKSISVSRPGDHVWSDIRSIDDLSNVMTGLARAAEAFLHPSILGSAEIMRLLKILTELYDDTGGVASIPQMLAVIETRLSERAANLRQKASGQEATILPFDELPKGSQDMMSNLEDDAKASFRSLRNSIDRRSATGETRVGRRRKVPEGLGPLGKPAKYQRKGEAQDALGTEPERPKRGREITCARCAGIGHISRGCKKPYAKVSKLPAAIQALGRKIRDDDKIGYEDCKPRKD